MQRAIVVNDSMMFLCDRSSAEKCISYPAADQKIELALMSFIYNPSETWYGGWRGYKSMILTLNTIQGRFLQCLCTFPQTEGNSKVLVNLCRSGLANVVKDFCAACLICAEY